MLHALHNHAVVPSHLIGVYGVASFFSDWIIMRMRMIIDDIEVIYSMTGLKSMCLSYLSLISRSGLGTILAPAGLSSNLTTVTVCHL